MLKLSIKEHHANKRGLALAIAEFKWSYIDDLAQETVLLIQTHHYKNRKTKGCSVSQTIGSLRGSIFVSEVEILFSIPQTRKEIESVFDRGEEIQTIDASLPKDLFADGSKIDKATLFALI